MSFEEPTISSSSEASGQEQPPPEASNETPDETESHHLFADEWFEEQIENNYKKTIEYLLKRFSGLENIDLPTLVEDAVQTASLNVWAHRRDFKGTTPKQFKNLFTEASTNALFDQLRRLRRLRKEVPLNGLTKKDATENIKDFRAISEDDIIGKISKEEIMKEVKKLPAVFREIIIARLDNPDIKLNKLAARLNLNENTAKVHWFRAVKALRKIFLDKTAKKDRGRAAGVD